MLECREAAREALPTTGVLELLDPTRDPVCEADGAAAAAAQPAGASVGPAGERPSGGGAAEASAAARADEGDEERGCAAKWRGAWDDEAAEEEGMGWCGGNAEVDAAAAEGESLPAA